MQACSTAVRLCNVLCCAVQLDITKAWVDMHHPRSPRVTYFDTLFLKATPEQAAGDVWQAALQYARKVSHKQAVSVSVLLASARHRAS